ncbi:MAG: hypothetical protein M1819_005463 [Sarea resinae]|nr:MAG: hypothetical protein M1819_005463 [Sarea resinae]
MYEYSRPVDCSNVENAILDPALIVCYMTSIVGFAGLVPPSHQLWKQFDDNQISIADYQRLKENHKEEMMRETAKLLIAVRSGEHIPLGTRVFLFDDSVTVDKFSIHKTEQYVTLRTARKHTFRDGISRHQFRVFPGFPNKLLFFNWGEGRSAVPSFDVFNNLVASLMWSASGKLGAMRYQLFLQQQPSDDEVFAFVIDEHQSFAKAIGFWKDPELHGTASLLKLLGVTFGRVNLHIVSYYHYTQDQANDWAARELQRSRKFQANQPTRRTRVRTVTDDDMRKSTTKRLQVMTTVSSSLEYTTKLKRRLAPQLLTSPMSLEILGDDEDKLFREKLEAVVKEYACRRLGADFLSQQRPKGVQTVKDHVILFDGPGKAIERVREDLFAFGSIQGLLRAALESMWEETNAEVLGALWQYVQGGDSPPKNRFRFDQQKRPKAAWSFRARADRVFLGEHSITTLWINEAIAARLARPEALSMTQNLCDTAIEEQWATKRLLDAKRKACDKVWYPHLKVFRLKELEDLQDRFWKQERRIEDKRQRLQQTRQLEEYQQTPEVRLAENERKVLLRLSVQRET